MSKNFWEDEENAPEVLSEEESEEVLTKKQEAEEEPEEAYEDALDDLQDALEEDEEQELSDEEVMSDARLRLEQGRLYEMLMDHNLFDGVSADSRAVKNVEREFKTFIKERLEILLGIKTEQKKTALQEVFTETEISLLKGLVGRVINRESYVAQPAPQIKKEVAPAPRLKSLVLNEPIKKKVVEAPVRKQVAPSRPASKVVVKKEKQKNTPKKEPNRDKLISDMNAQELLEFSQARKNRYYKAMPPKKLAMPSADQAMMYYAQTPDYSHSGLPIGGMLSSINAHVGVQDVGYPGDDI